MVQSRQSRGLTLEKIPEDFASPAAHRRLPKACAVDETEPWRWTKALIDMRYTFGEVLLGSWRFPAFVARTHFTELLAGAVDPRPPFLRFPPGLLAAKIPSCPVHEEMRRFAISPHYFQYAPNCYRHFYIDLAGSFDDYLAKFSSKSRYTVRKKVRRFEEYSDGAIAWRAYDDKARLDEFYGYARDVSRKTYQERLLNKGLPDRPAFDEEMDAAPSVRAYLLFHGAKPIAFMCCPEQRGGLLYEHVGYDPAYREFSPGTVLMFLALRAIFAEGRYKIFDFTEGEGAHKALFANREALCAEIYFFRRSLRCAAMVVIHAGLAGFSRGLVKLLEKTGVKSRLKNLLRHGIREQMESS